MPDEQKNNEGDLNNPDAGQAGEQNNEGNGEGGEGEETITIKKSELEKIKSDRDNYRTATLNKKADERELKKKEEENKEGGEGGAEDQIDETKVKEIAQQGISEFTGKVEQSNEKRAKQAFLNSHKEYIDDVEWQGLMGEFSTKRGKATKEDILDDLEDALLLHKKNTGRLEEHLESERERGRNEGRIEAEAGTGHQAGGVGENNEGAGSGKSLSVKGEEMARKMHVDPEKVKKVDPSKDNVIEIN